MNEEIPEGINSKQWGYYQRGRAAYAEGQPKAAAMCVFMPADRAWFLAGWIDEDLISQSCKN